MTIAEALKYIKRRLSEASGGGALHESELILQHLLHTSRSRLYLFRNNAVPEELHDVIDEIIARRTRNEPLPYILGSVYFHSMDFLVTRNVLIPRPDTEMLVETVLESENESAGKFLEIGLGSGAVSTILLQTRPQWRGIGTDISSAALRIAKENCPGTIHLLCADLFSALKPLKLFDFIVSNPPYISASEMAELDPDVRNFEPAIALDGGEDGLDFYRRFAKEAGDYLKPGGRFYCEIGYLQKEAVMNLFSKHGWKNIEAARDLGGRWRVVKCQSN
jgi:release factor glutamine methyltransferase